MKHELHTYQLNPHELELELGTGAQPQEVQKQADRICQNWGTPEKPASTPFILLLGGFQGAGKTTTIAELAKSLEFLIISPDEIRHNLFAEQFPFSEEFIKIVNATKIEVVKRALRLGHSVVIDQAITPDRVKFIKKILEDHPEYLLRSIFLAAPIETLKQRVMTRAEVAGRYRGTIPELEASLHNYIIRYGKPKKGDYDLIIESSELQVSDVAKFILSRLR